MNRYLSLLVFTIPSAALAQDVPPPPPPEPAPAPAPAPAPVAAPLDTHMAPPPTTIAGQTWIGGGAELTFGNNVGVMGSGGSQTYDLVSTIAFEGTFDYQISDALSFRAMPRYEIGLKGDGATTSASLWDFRAGLTVGKAVSPVMRLHGLAAVGWGYISAPSDGGGPDSASGVTLTFGGGLDYTLSPTLRLVAELTYEKGLESVSYMGQSADFNLNGFALGVGLQTRI